MSLEEHKILFFVVLSVPMLLAVSPGLSRLLVFPRTEFFTELWLLGSNHKAEDYPFNITAGEEYRLFLGIGNQLGYAAYYKVAVKLSDQNQSRPDSFNRTPSTLPPLLEIRAFVADEDMWETPLTFSLNYSLDTNQSHIQVHSVTLNSAQLSIGNCTSGWDSERDGFYYSLFFEAWIYNMEAGSFQYHERFVSLWLNMTV